MTSRSRGTDAGRWRRDIGILAAIVALGVAAEARADLLYFRRGGAVQLPSQREGSKVIVHAPAGAVAFEVDEFRRIVPGGDPPSEWPTRRDSARPGGGDVQLAAAWWALENGLTPEATAALRDLHASDPKHEPTATLVRTLDAITPPLPDPDVTSLTTALAGTFRTSETPHYVLLHQGSDADAAARLDVLERVYTTFYLTFAGQGIVLPPPKEKLVAAVFATQSDYLAFLGRENAGVFATTQGYYHPTRRAVISFDPRDLPALRRRAEAIRPGRDAARLALLLDLDRRTIDLGMAAHEGIHQLIAASRLAPRHDAFPTWLHEGLAAQFETIRGGRWAGVGRANDQRLPDWRSLRPAPRLAPLVRDEGFALGYRRDLYAQAWSLVYFLRKTRPTEFAGYLDHLRVPPVDDRPVDRPIDLFEPHSARTCLSWTSNGIASCERSRPPWSRRRPPRGRDSTPPAIDTRGPAGRIRPVHCTGRSSAWLERTVRVREVGGSNPLAPTLLCYRNPLSPTNHCSGRDTIPVGLCCSGLAPATHPGLSRGRCLGELCAEIGLIVHVRGRRDGHGRPV